MTNRIKTDPPGSFRRGQWTPSEVAHVLELADSGLDAGSISAKVRRPLYSVRETIRHRGRAARIVVRPPRPPRRARLPIRACLLTPQAYDTLAAEARRRRSSMSKLAVLLVETASAKGMIGDLLGPAE